MTHKIRCHLATLIQIVRRLDTISPNERLRTRASVIESHRRDRGDEMKEIISMIEMLDVPHAEEIILGKSVTEAIIQSLSYPSMSHRYKSVLESYPETFEWAFRDTQAGQLPWSNLSQWLRAGEGIYHVAALDSGIKSCRVDLFPLQYISSLFSLPRFSLYLSIRPNGSNTVDSHTSHQPRETHSHTFTISFFSKKFIFKYINIFIYY